MKEKIRICKGRKCSENGSARTAEALTARYGSENIEWVECMGYCEIGPNLTFEGIVYHGSRSRDITERIENRQGEPMKETKFDDLKLDELI